MGRLVLAGKTGETFAIGSDVVVEVVEARPGKCRLAFEAPTHMDIVRGSAHINLTDLTPEQFEQRYCVMPPDLGDPGRQEFFNSARREGKRVITREQYDRALAVLEERAARVASAQGESGK